MSDEAHILIVDDEAEMRDAISEYLRLREEYEEDGASVDLQRGALIQTAFGMRFAAAVGIASSDEYTLPMDDRTSVDPDDEDGGS